MKKLISLLGAVLLVVSTAGVAAAAATYATSVVDYDGYFMNWDSTDGFYHNEVTEYPDAGADLSWLLGGVDETVAAGWGGDADGGTLTLYYETGFTADGTAAFDINVYGFGFAYNTPFNSSEMGAIKVYASSDGTNWTVISEYTGTIGEEDYVANPDFTFSYPGVPSTIMSIDLDDDISSTFDGVISYLMFELGDGTTGHGRAFFTSAIEGVNAVPVPAAVWLLGSGLLGLIGIRRRTSA
ncbi:VPLPA-CTERM sorting domain-containing protein [uncultured Desulfosarcina sp.]|uniref:VPLPA-CTERM sorting domain-containing protein n=1 Tax=uncultured Desulfosarcina sp. TaxID=218289 RepID=UPI0029C83695|nr:VPLPA-CTERM sorting domain-containing protein [uncultured Desulfosarcina sp.]